MKKAGDNIGSPKRRARLGAACACLATALVLGIGGLVATHAPDPQRQAPDQPELTAEPTQEHSAPKQATYNDARERDAALDRQLGYVHDELLLDVEPGTSAESVNAILAGLDFVATKDVSDQDLSRGFVTCELAENAEVDASIQALDQAGLKSQPNFVYTIAESDPADEDFSAMAAVVPNDANRSLQWMLDSTDAYKAWGINRCGDSANKVAVCVIDSGAQANHPDLKDRIVASYCSSSVNNTNDVQGHGTHVAGIAAAQANNGVGIAGSSYNANLVIIKATVADSGDLIDDFYTSTLTGAYNWLLKANTTNTQLTNAQYYGVRVVNMSLGGSTTNAVSSDDALAKCIDRAYAQNILTVTAGGNKSSSDAAFITYPGDYQTCLTVINLEQNSSGTNGVARSPLSNYNVDDTRMKNISAPGTSIYSTIPGSSYGYKTGTSMATPCVAGIEALLFSQNPSLTPAQAKDITYATAIDLGTKGWDRDTGYGEISAYHALQVASAKIAGDATTPYKTRGSLHIEYGDGTSWETYGTPGDWIWSCSNESVAKLVIDEQAGTVGYDAIAPGTATITATYKKVDGTSTGYSVSMQVTVEELDLEHTSISGLAESGYTYNASPITPAITVRTAKGGVELVQGTDYAVSYEDNLHAGQATVTISGLGNCVESKTQTFTINPASLGGASFGPVASVQYTGDEHQPTPAVTLAGFGTLVAGTDFTYGYSNNVGVGTASITVTGTGDFTGTASTGFSVTQASLSGASVTGLEALTYTGSALEQAPVVMLGGREVSPDDYTVSYSGNVNVGTATVTVTGSGNYTSSAQGQFAIRPASIAAAKAGDIAARPYDGKAHTPTPALSLEGFGTLRPGTDYTCKYDSNVNAGTATLTFSGTGNYTGKAYASFQIEPLDLANVQIAPINDQAYTGRAVKPAVSASLGGTPLVEGTDFTTYYEDNVEQGTATVTITGTGNYAGRAHTSFDILLPLTASMVSRIPAQTYTGKPLEPVFTVSTVGKVLRRTANYSVTYGNNVSVGRASATITGIEGCAGQVTVEFDIVPASIANASIYDIATASYTGSEVTPSPTVRLSGHGTLVEGTDYELSYANNVGVAKSSDVNPPTVTVTGKGNYAGACSTTFAISAASISSAQVETLPTQSYTGSAISPEPQVTANGKRLVKDVDYKLDYYNNVNIGTGNILISGLGNYKGSKAVPFAIGPASIEGAVISAIPAQRYTGEAIVPDVTVSLPGYGKLRRGTDYSVTCTNNIGVGTATVTIKGLGSRFKGTKVASFAIEPKQVSPSVSISATTVVYNGSPVTQGVTVKDGGRPLTAGTDYEVTHKSNNAVGTATVEVKLKGNYTGAASKSYSILPKGTSLKKLTAAKKSAKVYWSKQPIGISGYQIAYSTSSKFKNAKYGSVGNPKASSVTIKKLAGGKKYFVKIRTFKIVNGNRIYSSWSKVLTVKPKK